MVVVLLDTLDVARQPATRATARSSSAPSPTPFGPRRGRFVLGTAGSQDRLVPVSSGGALDPVEQRVEVALRGLLVLHDDLLDAVEAEARPASRSRHQPMR